MIREAAGRRVRLADALVRRWWRPRPRGLAVALLRPLSWAFAAVVVLRRFAYRARILRSARLPVPVIVVGNLIAGGAGKTPTVVALVQWLLAEGWSPGVVARGHGRDGDGVLAVDAGVEVRRSGDEPALIRRLTGVPVVVGRHRIEAARRLLHDAPEVDVLVSDDGLQHFALARDIEIVVFDGRGAGNGLLLPAGPLREPLSTLTAARRAIVLYNASAPSTALAGSLACRSLSGVRSLDDWRLGGPFRYESLAGWRGTTVRAAAGIAEPERFFSMLRAEGIGVRGLPLPDHAAFDPPPWDADAGDVFVTEKDAVKLGAPPPGTRVWVVGLDFALPPELLASVRERLARAAPTATP